jgi:hypothetical protein
METIAGFSKLSAAGGAVLAHCAVTVVRGDDEKWEAYMGLFD